MQLNIYVPRHRADLLDRLDVLSSRSGRPKNELVLEALERYLLPPRRRLGSFSLGVREDWARADLYDDRLSLPP